MCNITQPTTDIFPRYLKMKPLLIFYLDSLSFLYSLTFDWSMLLKGANHKFNMILESLVKTVLF